MRFSKSRDGVVRATLRVEHRMTREDLIDALSAEVAAFHVVEELPKKIGEAKAMEMVKNSLTYRSDYHGWDSDDLSDADEIREWATNQVDRLWPVK